MHEINLKEVGNEEMQCEGCQKEIERLKIGDALCKKEDFYFCDRFTRANISVGTGSQTRKYSFALKIIDITFIWIIIKMYLQ